MNSPATPAPTTTTRNRRSVITPHQIDQIRISRSLSRSPPSRQPAGGLSDETCVSYRPRSHRNASIGSSPRSWSSTPTGAYTISPQVQRSGTQRRISASDLDVAGGGEGHATKMVREGAQ
jgi:hypothetical protein